ncbi:HU family DNA-binding protein [Gracilibacillus sp. HCP3S3_G5_1]|uniref:HU family DNA-binding protein n=1 Tax=unclassified Gracilibacillus TaxID=2625209 RepID=UPI003F8CF1F3
MNNQEVIQEVALKSGVRESDCERVLQAFEEVLNSQLADSSKFGNAFDKVYQVLHYFHNKKNTK